jgi:hypothetical protein
MATARTHQSKSTIGSIFHFLNPFRSKAKNPTGKSASDETTPTMNAVHQPTSDRPHQKRKRNRPHRHQRAKAAAGANAKPQDLDRHDVRPEAHDVNAADPAHRPGHRTFDVKAQFPHEGGGKVHTQKSALDNYPDSERIRQMESPQRRINSPSRRASKRGRSLPKSTH